MAKKHGKNAVLKIDDSGGTLRDISSYADSEELNRETPLADVTGFGQGSNRFVVGLKGGRITCSGSYDAAAATDVVQILDGIYGQDATVSFEVGPGGSATGERKYTGECRLANYRYAATTQGRTEWSAEFTIDGDVTTGTY